MLKKLVNNYAYEKFKHLELSDTILEHSQIFSDSIQILQALGQAICMWILLTMQYQLLNAISINYSETTYSFPQNK